MNIRTITWGYLFLGASTAWAGVSTSAGRYIVETRAGFESALSGFKHEDLASVGLSVVEIVNSAQLRRLRASPAVVRVEKDQRWKAPKAPAAHTPSLTSEIPWGIEAIHAPAAWEIGSAGKAGAGARVAVLDTGADKTHPDLVGRFEKGRDFTGAKDPTEIKDDVGHGTHVAGTILGERDGKGVTGVAPEARLLVGRICDKSGCSTSDLVKGLDWAVSEKVDLINLSIGSSTSSSSVTKALQAAEAAGVMVVAASGNENKSRISFPASLPTVFAVGAVDRTLQRAIWNKGAAGSNYGPQLGIVAPGDDIYSSMPQGSSVESRITASLDEGAKEFASVVMLGSPFPKGLIRGEIVDVGFGGSGDYDFKDLTGKIALVERGSIKFREKIDRAHRAHAMAVIIFNNIDGLRAGTILDENGEGAPIAAVMIEQKSGQDLRARLKAEKTIVVDFDLFKSSWGSMSGTSMACPHVAGVAALVRAANHALTPAQVRDLLKSTAWAHPTPKNEYGAGVVNAEAAVHAAVGN